MSYYWNRDESEKIKVEAETIIGTIEHGSLLIYGNVTVKDSTGNLIKKNKATALCRCGGSSNKPYCDGSHKKNGFQS